MNIMEGQLLVGCHKIFIFENVSYWINQITIRTTTATTVVGKKPTLLYSIRTGAFKPTN
jgi:hypothetical protein